MLNLHLQDRPPVEKAEEKVDKKAQDSKEGKKKKKFNPAKFIEEELEEKIYKKLKYFPDGWYEEQSIEFVFTDEAFRIINKVRLALLSNFIPTSNLQMAPRWSSTPF